MKRMILVLIGIVVVALSCLIFYSYHLEIGVARARVSARSQVAGTSCGLIEYAERGEGPPLLAIHGAGGGFDQGLDFVQPWANGHFRVIAPSRFGYLRTPLPADASVAAQADAHACLLDVLKVQKVAVIAASAGAPSAMQFCLRHPERCSAMVLLVPLAFAPAQAGAPKQQPTALAQFVMNATLRSDFLFWTATKIARGTMTETILGTPLADYENASPEEQKRVRLVLQHILPIRERQRGLQNEALIATSLSRYELERITAPTLIVSAEDDLYRTYDRAWYTAEQVRGARFTGFPSGGHLLVGHQQEVWLAVTDLLNAQSSEERSLSAR